MDRLADPTPLEKIQGSNIINKKELYISPELYKKLQGKDKTLAYSAPKNDLYALGLTILNLGTQESHQDIYKQNGEFDQNRLEEHLNSFDTKYGEENPFLVTVLRTILRENESERPDTETLQSNMISYEEFKELEAKGENENAENVEQEEQKQVVNVNIINQGNAQPTP